VIPDSDARDTVRLVAAQLGRPPRTPWRIAACCIHGFPAVIVSPPLLSDDTPFPTWAWLTCPHLVGAIHGLESEGRVAYWNQRVASDADLAAAVLCTENELRRRRLEEARECGVSPPDHEETGIAGTGESLRIKCLHSHVALELAGVMDPVGRHVLEELVVPWCSDRRCERLRMLDELQEGD
jgi:hypothetical protein